MTIEIIIGSLLLFQDAHSYQDNFTLPTELLEQVIGQGLDFLLEVMGHFPRSYQQTNFDFIFGRKRLCVKFELKEIVLWVAPFHHQFWSAGGHTIIHIRRVEIFPTVHKVIRIVKNQPQRPPFLISLSNSSRQIP
ncbi:MAG TPA: hypothetical protein VLD65_12470, partial [Anaerolineales bacterium]|nr:hypothetical protein [Anaerolineales bacterium]